MNTGTAQTSIKKVTATTASLEPSVLITLFEIDISELIARSERVVYSDSDFHTSLRFHNNTKLIQSSIWWNGTEYHPAPVKAEGFETSAKGSPPSPKLSIAVNFEGLTPDTADRIKYLKFAIRDLDSLSGAKVTRYRTFAKYLDCSNFYTDCTKDGKKDDITGTGTKLISNTVPAPEDFDSDPNAFFPPDIYYIDRKSGENSSTVEFELASPFDLQELKLPARVVTESTCVWTYRGEGCCYEYNNIKTADAAKYTASTSIFYSEHGECKAKSDGTAPPISTKINERIVTLLAEDGFTLKLPSDNTAPPLWNSSTTYKGGDAVRVSLKGVNYYFVSKDNGNLKHPPPNTQYWYADECSKSLDGCRQRWTNPLPFGGFPTSRRGGTS